MSDYRVPNFRQVRENWKMSGNLSGEGKSEKGQGKIFLEKSGKMKKIGAIRCQIFRL